jgi:sugar/nucleoside kinase (ribokinase family)
MEALLNGLEGITYRHLHFPSLFANEAVLPIIHQCHEQGIQVSMDCQFQTVTLDSPLVRHILAQVDIFMPNAGEAQKLTQTATLSEAVNILSGIVPYLVVKNGADGALARRNGADYREPALNVDAIDTTGAGDIFNGGFLAAYIEGFDTATCLRWGNYCAGCSTQSAGPAAAPTRAQLEAWLEGQAATG